MLNTVILLFEVKIFNFFKIKLSGAFSKITQNIKNL